MVPERRLLRNLDYPLAAAVAVCVLFGCAMIYSATRANPGLTGGDPYSLVKKQALAAALALAASFLVIGIDYRYLARLAKWIYAGSIGFIISVFFLGTRTQGALAWIRLGPLAIQPSEYAKIGVVVALAAYLAERENLSTLRSLIVPCVIVLVPMGLVVAQNDLGSALVFAPMLFAMLYAAGANPRLLVLIIAGGLLVAAPAAYFFALDGYQRLRILVFLNPGMDPTGAGYNIIQSVIAIGSGGLLGLGYGQSTQARLNFLPAHHTDFIFSVIAEELGFFGAATVLGMLFFIVFRGYAIAGGARDRFGGLVAVGITSTMLVHIFVNAGMTMNVSPCTGIPLPFLSAGGSSLIATMLGIALLQNIHMRRQKILF
ncbi:MAG: rod shape-determining protein RodA [Firmicutes bacterium]|jgi:rod shape determining protein RodA|nr:rod shape-determining protein RodA [Bacillota bacterium]